MTATITIRDQYVSQLSFLDTVGFYLTTGGWQQNIGLPNERGDYEDVRETIALDWMQTNDDDRATKLRSLMKLAAKAREYVRTRRLGDPVWIEVRTHSETEKRYAIVKDIIIQNLSERHWYPEGPASLVVTIVREGLWRGIAPNGSYESLVSGLTIYPFTDGTYQNYTTITDSLLDGDAPGLVTLQIAPSAGLTLDRFIIATKVLDATGLSQFDAFFNPADELDNTAGQQSDSDAPDGINLTLTGSSDATLRWTIAGSKMGAYEGAYHVYAVALSNSASEKVSIAFKHGSPSNGYEIGNYMPVTSGYSTYRKFVYLGRFTLPVEGPLLPGYAYTDPYTIALEVDKSDTVTFYFYSLMLIPADQVFRAHVIDGDKVRIDGNLEISVPLGSSNDLVVEGRVATYGRYIQLEPRLTTAASYLYSRLYVFHGWHYNGVDYYRNRTDDSDLDVEFIPRYVALRGNQS